MYVLIDREDRCLLFTDRGCLARYLDKSRETVTNWFRRSNCKEYDGQIIYRADGWVKSDRGGGIGNVRWDGRYR